MFEELENRNTSNFEQYWEAIRRRRWLIIGTVFVCWVVGWGIGWVVPPTYESEAGILVEQQAIPKDLVTPNVTITADQQLETLQQQVLSRTRLQNLIDQYHLYANESRLVAMFEASDPVDQMRKDISIALVTTPGKEHELTGFTITYGARKPQIANAVVSQLANYFIDQNTNSQELRSAGTTDFFQAQLEDAKARLDKQEQQVQAFKAQHIGELPDQQQSNLQILSGLQGQLGGAQAALAASKQHKLYLESLIQQYQTALDAGGDSELSPATLDKQLRDMRMQLAEERAQYTDSYPDVIALKDQIAKTEALKKQMDEEAAKAQKSGKSANGLPAEEAAEVHNGQLTPMMQIQSQVKANQMQIQNEEKRENDLEARVAQYQARLNMTPAVEQQLEQVSRGYKQALDNYNSLLGKQNASQLATSLEQNQQGEKFTLVDPASLPTQPAVPLHILISIGGLVFGLALAAGLAILLEMTNACIRQEKDLVGIVSARVLVGIPVISTPQERQERIIRRWMERGVAVAIVLVIVAGNIYAFYRG